MSQVLLLVTSEAPYDPSPIEEDDDTDEDEGFHIAALVTWDREYWAELEKSLHELRTLCVRWDTKHVRLTLDLGDESEYRKLEKPNKLIHEDHDMFNNKYNVIWKLCQVQKVLAPIRSQLEAAVEENKEPDIEQHLLDEVLEYSKKDTLQAGVHEIVELLFQEEKKQTSATKARKTLKPIAELTELLQQSPFDLDSNTGWTRPRIWL
jgi:hypothetical protein